MIISASRRTDIPAFYAGWFMDRIREGGFESRNPFNPSQVKRISLLPEDVDVIVFWSKNPEPMLEKLDELDSRGFRYYFQYTLNDYPAYVEPGMPPLSRRLDTFRRLAARLGSGRVVWRYDPIMVGGLTPLEYHLDRFANIAGELSGDSRRVIISFADFYPGIARRLKSLEKAYGFTSYDITLPEHRKELELMVSGMGRTAALKGMEIFTCSEQLELAEWGIRHGSCIDAALTNDIFHLGLTAKKDRNQRQGCLCAPSVDIGVYNTCRHGCSYCYACR